MGQELKVEASYWDSENNVILSGVNKIGEQFLLLSNHHKEFSLNHSAESKKLFIQTVHEIVAETLKLIKAVESLTDACADKRLVTQMSQIATQTLTLAQTFKMVGAVQATAPRYDQGVQLISNAQNMASSVISMFRYAVSCSLRLKDNVSSDVVQFKKVIRAQGFI